MSSLSLTILILLLLVLLPGMCRATNQYHVSAIDGPPCPDGESDCHNLAHYLSMPDWYFTDIEDTAFHFMAGTHHFDATMAFSDAIDLLITADAGAVMECSSVVAMISVTNSQNLGIFNINVTDCQDAVPLTISNSYNITVENVELHSSNSTLVAVNALNITIKKSLFRNNVMIAYNSSISLVNGSTDYPLYDNINVELQDCVIENSQSMLGGLYIKLDQGTLYGVNVLIRGVMARNNSSPNMGITVSGCVSQYSIVIVDVISVNALKPRELLESAVVHPFVKSTNASLIVLQTVTSSVLTQQQCSSTADCADCSLIIRDSTFSDNENGGIFISTVKAVNIDNCTFSNNSHSAMWFHPLNATTDDYYPLLAFLTDTDFVVSNVIVRNTVDDAQLNTQACAICLFFVNQMVFENITVEENSLSGLLAFTSKFFIRGQNNIFARNKNDYGGGMHFMGNSLMVLEGPGPVSVHFEDNIAIYGSAVYVYSDYYGCFFHTKNNNSRLIFSNNHAQRVGSAIYGNFFHDCQTDVLEYEYLNNSEPVVSSPPIRTCLCVNGEQDCDTTGIARELYPGQMLTIEAMAVGENNKPTVGQMFVAYNNENRYLIHEPSFGTCATISVRALQEESYEGLFFLTASTGTPPDVTINVSFLECPSGFEYSNDTKKCECSSVFQQHASSLNEIACDIETQTFTRASFVWLGMTTASDNGVTCPILLTNCDHEFCTHQLTNFTINDTDSQCENGHTGFLCGTCPDGTGILIGAHKCSVCSNGHIALIIPYIIYGVLIVAGIIALNLTVPVATLNGIILWANIMQIYNRTLFPTGGGFVEIIPKLLSLEPTFEVCFSKEATACERIILDFVFPTLICSFNIVMFVLAHYFKRVANAIGNRLVPTLATLLIIVYNRVIVITSSIFLNHITTCDSKSTYYWLFSPGEPYGEGCHLFLMIVSLSVCLFIVFPHTIELLVFPFVEQSSRLRKYRIVQKYLIRFKPFHDAYGGPFNDWFRSWIGFTILLRIVLVLIVSHSSNRFANLLVLVALCALLVLLLSSGLVYNRKRHSRVHMLEIYFFIWLIVMAYIAQHDKVGFSSVDKVTDNENIAGALTLLNVLVLVGILLYHTCMYFYPVVVFKTWALKEWRRVRNRNKQEVTSPDPIKDTGLAEELEEKVVLRKYRPELLREPVLSYIYDSDVHLQSTQ